MYGAYAAKKMGIPLIWHERNLITNEVFDPDRIFSFLPNRIICNSSAIAVRFKKNGRIPSKIEIINNGVDTANFRPSSDGRKVRGEFGIGPDEIVIGIASRFNASKGHEVFLRAAKILLRDTPGITGKLRFLIVGSPVFDQDASMEKRLRDVAYSLAISGSVIFAGFREDMPEIYAATDIFVLASDAEPCGRVLIEAMASGKVLVATDSGGTPEIVKDNETGFLVESGNPEALAGKIAVLVRDRGLAGKMGLAGRKRTEERFDIRVTADKTQDLYKDVLRSKGSAFRKNCLSEAIASFMDEMETRRGLPPEKSGIYRDSLERFADFGKHRRLSVEDASEYLLMEDNFIIECFLQFLDRKQIAPHGLADFNNRVFKNALRDKKITTKDYDERVSAQTVRFQIDNFYNPGDQGAKVRIDFILYFLKPRTGEKILDMGCGVGSFAYHCAKAGARTCGVDYSNESILIAKQLTKELGVGANTEFICRDAAEKLPFDDRSFDKIVAADFIEHIDDIQKRAVLSEMIRLLKPGGIMIIFTPNGIREKMGIIKSAFFRLFGLNAPQTRLHYGLTDRFKFEKMLKDMNLAFDRRFFDSKRPYLAKMPVLNEILSLDILWVIKNKKDR